MSFEAIWSVFRVLSWKCSNMGAFWGLEAENASTWRPQDWTWAFWAFEISSLFLENSGLELKMVENVLFGAIWSFFFGSGVENARKWVPSGAWELNMLQNGSARLKLAFWFFEISPLILENSSLELKMCENVLCGGIWGDSRIWNWKCSNMDAFWGLGADMRKNEVRKIEN